MQRVSHELSYPPLAWVDGENDADGEISSNPLGWILSCDCSQLIWGILSDIGDPISPLSGTPWGVVDQDSGRGRKYVHTL